MSELPEAEVVPFILLAGEPGQVKAERRRLLRLHRDNNDDPMSVQKLDVSELGLEDLVSNVSTVSMFYPERVVLISDLGSTVYLHDHIESIANSVPDSVTVIASEPGVKKTDTLWKLVDTHADAFYYKAREQKEVIGRLVKLAEELGSELSRSDATYLVNRVGLNEMKLESDVSKLSVYESITRELIDTLTDPTPSSKVFDLLDAAVSGNLDRALDIYDDQRSQKTEPLAILALVIWQLQVIALARSGKGSDMASVSKRSGVSEYPLKKAYPMAKRLNDAQMNSLVELALDTDKRIRVDYVSADDAMKLLLARLTDITK